MKKLLIITALALLLPAAGLCWTTSDAMRAVVAANNGGGEAASYCDGTTWNTFTDFRLDADNTDNNHYVCLASGTELLTDVGTPTVGTPATAFPTGSGGNSFLFNADNEYLLGDNTDGYFDSKWGEILIKFTANCDGYTCQNTFGVMDITVDADNYMALRVYSSGSMMLYTESLGAGTIYIDTGLDFETSYSGDPVEAHIIWDTTRGTDEMAIRWRYDSDQNGSWDGPGAGPDYWSAWSKENDADALSPYTSEPGSDSIKFGIIGEASAGDNDVVVNIDDVQISNSQPSWPE